MSILSWLKTVTHGGTASSNLIQNEKMEFAAGEQEFHGLNMKDALDAHMAWTHRIEKALSGEGEQLEVAKVAPDHLCTLGKWIHGPAQQQFGSVDEYAELKRVHADFHLKCGEVVNNVVNGETQLAKEGLKAIRHQSGTVQLALVRLYAHANN